MKYLILLLLTVGCSGGYEVEGLDSTEHKGYVSVAESWREVCEDRFNKYDYPDKDLQDMLQAECRRKFADGEEVLDLPEIPQEGAL